MKYSYLQCSDEEPNLSIFRGLFLFIVIVIRTGNHIQFVLYFSFNNTGVFNHKDEEESLKELPYISVQIYLSRLDTFILNIYSGWVYNHQSNTYKALTNALSCLIQLDNVLGKEMIVQE